MALEASGASVRCDTPATCYALYYPSNEKAGEFQLIVNATVVPPLGYAKYQTETFFDGLTYNQDTCADENVWPFAQNLIHSPCTVGPAGQRILASQTYVTQPGPHHEYVGGLVELDVHCASTGTFSPFVGAAPRSPQGSYYEELGSPVYLATIGTEGSLDVDGDTTPDTIDVAAQLSITCLQADVDDDLDGCTNEQELGPDEMDGGRRDPLDRWDFFDTPAPGYEYDRQIDFFNDVLGIAARFGADDAGGTAPINRNTDPLSAAPAAPAYHPGFDRADPLPGDDVWDMQPPNGTIDMFTDIMGAAAQFGHDCL